MRNFAALTFENQGLEWGPVEIAIGSLTVISYLKAKRNSASLGSLKCLKMPLWPLFAVTLPLNHQYFSLFCTESQCSSKTHFPGFGGVLGHAAVVHRKY